MGFKGKMNVDAMGSAVQQSEDSGVQLIKLVEELADGVEDLKSTFQGNAANAYHEFMRESNRVQGQLVAALASINRGQADTAKAYIEMDDTMESDGSSAAGRAAGVSVRGFNIGS